MILQFNVNNKINKIIQKNWIQGKITSYSEVEIRYNQAVGFKTIIQETGLIDLEIIVDQSFPGTLLFQTYDLYVLADILRILKMIFPSKEELYHTYVDGDAWEDEELVEIETLINSSRLPELLKDYETKN